MKESTFFYKPPLVVASSKDNQAMKFDQLIEYNKNFVEKSWTKYGGETIPRPFSKKSKLSLSLTQQFVFILC